MHSKPDGTRLFRISSWAISLILGLGVAAGCGVQDLEQVMGDVRNSTSAPSGVPVAFEEFSDDIGTRAATESRALIRSRQAYQDFFGHAPPIGLDLARQWVIFYGAGTRPTGGYDANILSLTRSGGDLVAVTELVSPGANCPVTQSLTAPHVLIKFLAQHGASISFAKKDRTQDCGPATNPCAAILCAPGSKCQVQDVVCVRAPCPPRGVCVPESQPVRCGGIAGIPCPGAGHCVDDPSDSCDPSAGGADCGGICTCVQNVLCVKGAVFDSSPAVCACVPDATVVHCGGIAGIPCPGDGRCIDDPSDGCDPNAGGADCGGICTCVQNVLCIKGAHFDGSPNVCACVPQKPACGPVCDIFCQYGHVVDANDCPTCQCNPAPAPRSCPPDKCPSPAPAAPNVICPDGVTVAGPACVLGANDTCGWTIVSCPPPAR